MRGPWEVHVLYTATRFLGGRIWRALVSLVQKQDGPVQPAKGFQVSNLVHVSLFIPRHNNGSEGNNRSVIWGIDSAMANARWQITGSSRLSGEWW